MTFFFYLILLISLYYPQYFPDSYATRQLRLPIGKCVQWPSSTSAHPRLFHESKRAWPPWMLSINFTPTLLLASQYTLVGPDAFPGKCLSIFDPFIVRTIWLVCHAAASSQTKSEQRHFDDSTTLLFFFVSFASIVCRIAVRSDRTVTPAPKSHLSARGTSLLCIYLRSHFDMCVKKV